MKVLSSKDKELKKLKAITKVIPYRINLTQNINLIIS